MSLLAPAIDAIRDAQPVAIAGRATAVRGLVVLVDELPTPVGSLVRFASGAMGEVVGFSKRQAVVMPLESLTGVRPGERVHAVTARPAVPIGDRMLGRVINGIGSPIDAAGPVPGESPRPLDPPPISALGRGAVTAHLRTGVRAIDLMTPIGRGQRMGIFAGPGVGKSTLLGQIARQTDADVSVIALIGERGREVREFIEDSLGPEGLERSLVVVATGDESPLMRLRAAKLACAAAEHFRDRGRHVVLMMDSVTRFAHAQRQVGLSAGEPPATKGYTPSVFAQMALLLERAGAVDAAPGRPGGSITGLYTILVEGDDMTEPIADAARGILDGHLILSRKLAQRGHFPAIDVLDSVSRVADRVTDTTHRAARGQLVRLLAKHRDVEELVQIGAYPKGSDPETDIAIEYKPTIDDLLQQRTDEGSAFDDAKSRMVKLALQSGEDIARRAHTAGVGG